MIEVPIPHDILKYKSKFIANFTARQFVFLCLGAAVGIFSYFTFFKNVPGGIYFTALTIIPFYLVGFVTIFGQPFEKIAWNVLYDNFICPAKRYYEVHHPEYEKLIRENTAEDLASQENVGKITSDESEKETNADNKVKKSKEFKAIR